MKIILLVAVVTFGISQGSPVLKDVETEWTIFTNQYGKQYKSLIEETHRKTIFSSNYERVVQHNKLYEQGIETYFLKINEKADLTLEEMVKLNGFSQNGVIPIEKIEFKPKEGATVPKSFDWRDKGAVTPVKNQRSCGSCWAFSTTGALEGQYFLKTGKLVSLSEQFVVDCSRNGENSGCNGGDMIAAFEYIHNNDGIESEVDYPYLARQRTCQYDVSKNVTSLKGYGVIKEGKEDDLKAAVATVGPISVAMDADHFNFQLYGGGIYYNKNCKVKPDDLDHAVLAVGYGTENNQDYWLVKNSWGPSWGIKGLFKIARNKDNNCGIASAASYPTMY